MPELPEVETVRSRLKSILEHKIIDDIEVLHPKSFRGDLNKVTGCEIQSINRKAKLLRIKLNNHENLLVHLKMTGQLVYVSDDIKIGGGHPTADWVKQLPSSHTRVIIKFKDKSTLYFNDMRIFGWIKELSDKKVVKELNKYGPDAIDDEFTPQYLQEKLKNRTIAIKQAIMIGEIVGGIGNIYASEALFVAGIDPRTSSQKLTKGQLKKLVAAIKQVIHEGIKYKGTTFDGKFVDVDGLAGQYQNKLRVYGREDEECPECPTKIKKVKIAGRGTYYCSNCQH